MERYKNVVVVFIAAMVVSVILFLIVSGVSFIVFDAFGLVWDWYKALAICTVLWAVYIFLKSVFSD